MKSVFEFCKILNDSGMSRDEALETAKDRYKGYVAYPDSLQYQEGTWFFISRHLDKKVLFVTGTGNLYGEFVGEEYTYQNASIKICEMSIENNRAIRKIFKFTNPANHHGINITMGLGDRLGLASAGHIRLLKGTGVFPVLAQQSIRELNLTGRAYEDVLAAAAWAVFQEGYTGGYGADGDHLKTREELKYALDNGFTMITLDCSEHIDNSITGKTENEIEKLYFDLPESIRNRLEEVYSMSGASLNDETVLKVSAIEFMKTVLIYHKAIEYTIDVYKSIIKPCGRQIDFEMSIDETLTSTSPYAHYYVANELISAGVEITSLAPRFCGEFQKGIDYRGDVQQFKSEFLMHFKIAEHFGYKISVHSGSDKFMVFPIIGRITGGKYHLKTAGTNWLEAVRVISMVAPDLFRRIYEFAVKNLPEARKYYHISADESKAADISDMKDGELPRLLDIDDSRQIIHITYGLILLAKNPDGTSAFKDDIYKTLDKNEDMYYDSLVRHIGRHLSKLGV